MWRSWPWGGITDTRAFATHYGPYGLGFPLAGLFDAGVELLRRFLGSRSGRKARYAALLVTALEPQRAPEPLTALLDRV